MKYIFEFIKPYKLGLVIAPFFKLLEAVFELVLPTLMVLIINVGVVKSDVSYIIKIAMLMLLMSFAGLASSLVCQFYAAKISQGVGTKMRTKMFDKIMKFSRQDVEEFGSSTLINRTTTDVVQVQTGIAMFIRLVIRAPFLCIGSIVMSLILNFRLGIIILVALPIFSVVLYLIIKKTLPLYSFAQSKLDHLGVIVRENLSGVRVIRAFANVAREKQKYKVANDDYKENIELVGRISSLTGPMSSFLVNMLITVVLFFGARQSNSGAIMQGEMIAFVSYIIQIMINLMVISQLVILFSKAYVSLERITQVYEKEPTLQDTKTISIPKIGKIIEFVGVSFKYPNSRDFAIKDITFDIDQKQNIGIIGSTGSGKSTIAKLIIRDYDVLEGEIKIKGNNIKQYSLSELKKTISIAAQQATLFSFSVRKNILLANINASDTQIWEALEIAQGKEFVENLPGGLDHFISRGSTNISGGQKQRLNIARAIAAKPELLILDDSSSALDYATAQALKESIRENMKATTVINISQRVSSVRMCDKIIVMKEGSIAGIGTHDFLKTQCEEYIEICNSQK